MGGYGHSRLREFILGGTTRGMFESLTVPALISHLIGGRVTYRSLMVHLDLEQGSEPALRVAHELADRFKSKVIGVTAGLPAAPIHAGRHDRDERARGRLRAPERGHRPLRSPLSIGTQGSRRLPGMALGRRESCGLLAAEARAADLLVVGRSENDKAFGPYQLLDIGDTVMKAGRPVLVVPPRRQAPASFDAST